MSKQTFTPSLSASTKEVEEDGNRNIKLVEGGKKEVVLQQQSNTKDYTFTGVNPGKIYIHPPNRLITGRIIYHCKYLGHLRVPEARGNQIIKDAVDKLMTVAEVNKTNLDEELPEVDLSVSIRSLATVDRRTKKALHQHPLPLISFSADDKRKKNNMFAYISRGKPPATEHICYVYQCSESQAQEITATVGQAFELAYKKFLETKKAQEDFKRLKAMLATASPEQKEVIEKKLVVVNKIRAAEAERKKKMMAIQAKMPDTYVKPVTKIVVKEKGSGLYTGSGRSSSAMFEGESREGESREEEQKTEEDVQKEVKKIELDSERERQKKKITRKESSSVEAKWENITTAMDAFQMEPTMDPGTQHLVRHVETRELDSAITDLEKQIDELEEAFDWRRRQGQGPVVSFPIEEEVTEVMDPKVAEEYIKKIDGAMWIANAYADMDVPDLPANYVMDEFMKAKEKAAMPKEGTVKSAAGSWLDTHHD